MSSSMSSFLLIDNYQKGVISQDLNKKKITNRFIGKELFVWKEDKKRVVQFVQHMGKEMRIL